MNIEEFIRDFKPEDTLVLMFDWNGRYAEKLVDKNLSFRRQVLDYYSSHRDQIPLEVIAALYQAETQYAREIWGVHPLVKDLAQDLLERGRTRYIKEYLSGLGCGMDAYVAACSITLSPQSIQELLNYCDEVFGDEPESSYAKKIAIFENILLGLREKNSMHSD